MTLHICITQEAHKFAPRNLCNFRKLWKKLHYSIEYLISETFLIANFKNRREAIVLLKVEKPMLKPQTSLQQILEIWLNAKIGTPTQGFRSLLSCPFCYENYWKFLHVSENIKIYGKADIRTRT